jgi:hypothetical protein
MSSDARWERITRELPGKVGDPVGEDDVKLFKYHVMYESLPSGKTWTARSWRFTCRTTSISNGITAIWKLDALVGGRQQ